MIELGRKQFLTVLREKEIGVYLGETESDAGVLLPRKEVPEGTQVGDTLEVFIYKDSEDRLIATTLPVPFEVGEVACLPVSQVTDIGAFLDWGLVKELFLPFKEQRGKLRPGMQIPVLLYVDKSQRLCATMYIYKHLQKNPPYQKNDRVTGIVYEIKPELGAFLAVDRRYYGMIPKQELYESYRPGDEVSARVLKVRPDGKLDLSARRKAHAQMNEDAEKVWQAILEYDGELPFTDKTDPEIIKRELSLSKNAFKRAVGRLLKEGRIEIWDQAIVRKR